MATGNPYVEVSVQNYNQNPPTDDAQQTAANTVEWAKHKDKLGDPIKTAFEQGQTNLTAALDQRIGNGVTDLGTNYTQATTDRGKVLNFTAAGNTTLTLLPVATAKAGFEQPVTNSGTGSLTIDGDGSETIDGNATIIIPSGRAALLFCDGSEWIDANRVRSVAADISTSAKTGAYTVVAGDNNRTILCDASGGAFTITLTAAATLGDGFVVRIKKDASDTSSNAITVDADGSETIDGDLTRIIRGLEQVEEYTCDGTTWHITSALPDRVLLGRQTASATTNIDFTDLDTTYDHYELEYAGVRPTSDQVEGWIRLSTNNGSTFISGASSYQRSQPAISTSVTSESEIKITNNAGAGALSNAANDFMTGVTHIYLPAESSKTHTYSDISFISASATAVRQFGTWGRYDTAAVTDAVRFTLSSGTIAEGEFRLYGVRK